ncbi:hypothetical protein OPQ81_010659 [Rhizoctonia solani]|nr:hypothetical protein OPQ81_010659 [Rhizoctonia solani]
MRTRQTAQTRGPLVCFKKRYLRALTFSLIQLYYFPAQVLVEHLVVNLATERLMSTHLHESAHPFFHIRHGEFAYPLQAVQRKEKRCLDASRKECVDSVQLGVGSYQVRRYVSADGRLYFGYKQFLSPNNLADHVVFSAFLIALRELSQYFNAQNTQPGRFEVVITLQCVSKTEPQFCYYFVDHHLHRVSDESILIGNVIDHHGDHHGAAGWSKATYWDHIAIFSAHRLCTTADYDQVRILLLGLQAQSLASLDTRNDDALNKPDALLDLLSQFDRISINSLATASIAKIMKRILSPPPAPRARHLTSLGSSILCSLRGILLPGDPSKDHSCSNFDGDPEDDAHPSIHENSFERCRCG